MRPTRCLSAVSVVILTFLLTLIGLGPAHAAGRDYVALGDSYSSGNGADAYITSSGDCHRSNNAYPAEWAAQHAPSSFGFVACSGARTTDVTNYQTGALSSSTDLVSVTVGGNDAGFSDVMYTCVTGSTSACESRIDEAEAYIRNTLPGRLDTTYDAIRSRAPSARVVVMGYPRMYIEPSWWCPGIGETKREAINDASDLLNSVISGRASAHGFVFGDVRPTFDTHELCSGDDWLHDLQNPDWESYHPTARGHASGYLPVLNARD